MDWPNSIYMQGEINPMIPACLSSIQYDNFSEPNAYFYNIGNDMCGAKAAVLEETLMCEKAASANNLERNNIQLEAGMVLNNNNPNLGSILEINSLRNHRVDLSTWGSSNDHLPVQDLPSVLPCANATNIVAVNLNPHGNLVEPIFSGSENPCNLSYSSNIVSGNESDNCGSFDGNYNQFSNRDEAASQSQSSSNPEPPRTSCRSTLNPKRNKRKLEEKITGSCPAPIDKSRGTTYYEISFASAGRQKRQRSDKTSACNFSSINFGGQHDGGGEFEPDTEAMAQVKEMIYRAAAMRPVNLGVEESVEKPKRKNVKISNDPQTVAARLRRERVSERLRVLQRLVPGGNKMDTATMLDEAANYLKFLKAQVRALEGLGGGGRLSNDHHDHGAFVAAMMINNNGFDLSAAAMQNQTPLPHPKP